MGMYAHVFCFFFFWGKYLHLMTLHAQVDFCGPTTGPTDPAAGRVSVQAGPQYDAWNAFGEALNKTGRPIYYSICPHRVVEKGQGLPGVWDGRMAYAPPPEWTAEQRYNLANSILVEYVNTYDEWYRGMYICLLIGFSVYTQPSMEDGEGRSLTSARM